jgi:hypothetical protein
VLVDVLDDGDVMRAVPSVDRTWSSTRWRKGGT